MELFDQEDWFALMAKDPDMPTLEEIDPIKEFMDGKTTADIAAQRCTSRIYLEEENPDPTLIWSLLESLAVEFPNTQEKIVELLAAIKRRPNPIRDGKEHRIYSQKTFSDLGYFRADFFDYFTGVIPPPNFNQRLSVTPGIKHANPTSFHTGSKVSIPISWARVNAFSARLTANLVQDFRRYGVETIEDALEEKNLKENHTREFFLPAAANQIIFASYPIWNLRNDPELEHHTMVLEWNRWKQTFEELTEHSQLSQETRGLLQQAVAAMEAVAQDPDRDDWQRKLVQYQAQYRASLNSRNS